MFSRKDTTTPDRSSQDDAHRTTVTPPTPPTATPSTSPSSAFQPAPQPATPQARATPNGDESLVAREDIFEGKIKVNRGVRVMGTVRGSIESTQYVHIEEHAQVEADIVAAEVVIAGTYTGTLNCRQRVEIRSTGTVSGKIETEKLMLHEGGYFDGELHMQKPSDRQPAPTQAPPAASGPEARDNQLRRPRHIDLPSDTPIARDSGSSDNKPS